MLVPGSRYGIYVRWIYGHCAFVNHRPNDVCCSSLPARALMCDKNACACVHAVLRVCTKKIKKPAVDGTQNNASPHCKMISKVFYSPRHKSNDIFTVLFCYPRRQRGATSMSNILISFTCRSLI